VHVAKEKPASEGGLSGALTLKAFWRSMHSTGKYGTTRKIPRVVRYVN
jgi:hypothetical protein